MRLTDKRKKILLNVLACFKLCFNTSIWKNIKHIKYKYSQTCSSNHLYKTTTRLRQPMLSLPKQIPIQLLLHKRTTCLMQPATTFFVSQMKKNLPKTTTTKLYPVKKWETNIRQQCIKNICFSDYIYSSANL